jgi:hypothetical protein
MSDDILDRLDAVLAEADATTDALCEQYFADAMAGVRQALDRELSQRGSGVFEPPPVESRAWADARAAFMRGIDEVRRRLLAR